MRLFKKFLLATGLVGLISSLGFASKAMAAGTYGDVVKVDASVSGTTVSWTVTTEEEDKTGDYVSGDREVTITDGPVITRVEISSAVGGMIIPPLVPTDEDDLTNSSIDLKEAIKNKLANEVSGKVTVKVFYKYSYYEDVYTSASDYNTSPTYEDKNCAVPAQDTTDDPIDPYYKVTVKTDNSSMGLVEVDGTKHTSTTFVCSPVDYPYVYATPVDGSSYEFVNWNKSSTLTNASLDLFGITAPTTYTAYFTDPNVVPLFIDVYATDGTTKIVDNLDATSTERTINLEMGQYMVARTSSPATIKGTGYDTYLRVEDGSTSTNIKFKAVGVTSTSARIYAGINDTSAVSANVKVNVRNTSVITLTDYVDYITDGYTLEFKAKAEDGSKNLTWGITEGSDFVNKIDTSYSDSTQTVKVVLNKKIDTGDNNKTIKLKCTVGNTSTIYKIKKTSDSKDTVDELVITDYSRPKLEYKSDRALEYTGPEKGNSGNESVGSDNAKIIAKADGVYIQAVRDSSVIGTSNKYIKDKGNKLTVAGKEVETMVLNMKDKFSGETDKVKFRFCMAGKDSSDKAEKWNNKIYGETDDLTVYRVVVKVSGSAGSSTTTDDTNKTSGGGVAMNSPLPLALVTPAGDLVATTDSATTKEYVYYGLEGQEIDISSIGKLKTCTNGTTDVADTMKIKVSSDTSKNTYTAVLGTRTDGNAAPDGQQKWGQGNTFAYIMMILVICGVCAGLYALNRKKSNI